MEENEMDQKGMEEKGIKWDCRECRGVVQKWVNLKGTERKGGEGTKLKEEMLKRHSSGLGFKRILWNIGECSGVVDNEMRGRRERISLATINFIIFIF